MAVWIESDRGTAPCPAVSERSNRDLSAAWRYLTRQDPNVSLSPVVCALRSGRLALGPPGTAVDARLVRQAHGHRRAQIERRGTDIRYCPRPIYLQKVAH